MIGKPLYSVYHVCLQSSAANRVGRQSLLSKQLIATKLTFVKTSHVRLGLIKRFHVNLSGHQFEELLKSRACLICTDTNNESANDCVCSASQRVDTVGVDLVLTLPITSVQDAKLERIEILQAVSHTEVRKACLSCTYELTLKLLDLDMARWLSDEAHRVN